MQVPPPAPTAQGSFTKTPFPHLLVYALDRALSGTFELHLPGDGSGGAAPSVATMLVLQGVPAKLRTTEGVHYLGDVMAELGLVSPEAVKTSHERMAESPRLQGQILKELGAVDDARLEAGLRAQLDRKLEHLFGLPAETMFSYYDGVDALQRYGGAPTPIDPLPALWRGVRQSPAWEHVDVTLRRVGGAALRIGANANLDRFQFTRVESSALELLKERPTRVVDLANAKVVGATVAQLLVYLLVITKQVDLVETPAVPTASAPASQAGPPSGQAFARVQLLAKTIQRAPLIIEEAPVARNAADDRIASPLPQPPATTELTPPIPRGPAAPEIAGMLEADQAQGSGGAAPVDLDIGTLISTTIKSSMPPPILTPAQGSAIPPPPASQPPGLAPSAEQIALKQKILERAAAISSQDYFEMLGLERNAPPDAVQKAFFGLARVWHPDRLPAALVDVKDACSKVFTHLTEAHATLHDPERRTEYMRLLKDGGATPDDQAKIHAILEAATEFQKAEIMLKRNDMAKALELARKARGLDPEQADYLAMVTWLESQQPDSVGRESTLEKIAVLDRCIALNANSERAYFWRGMLFKRLDDTPKAMKDFKKASELNPRNLDAMREVRLHNMRGGARSQSKPPPPGGSSRPSQRPPLPEKAVGLFGKLFKK
jgi:tetratricopeptide (TPR) repeat protein